MTQTTELAPDRYARLHRAIERGQANEETWAQLTAVCIKLGKQRRPSRRCTT